MQIGLNPGSQPAVIMNPDEVDFEVSADWKEWGEARPTAEALDASDLDLDLASDWSLDQPRTFAEPPGAPGWDNPTLWRMARIQAQDFRDSDVLRITDGEIREAMQHRPEEDVDLFLRFIHDVRANEPGRAEATGELAEAQAAVDEVAAGAPEAEEVAEGVAQLADAVEAVQQAAEDAGLDLDVAETASEAASDSGALYSWFSEALENAESGVEAILSDVEEFASDELAAAEGFLGEALGAVETAFEIVVGAAEEAGVVGVAEGVGEVALAVALA